MIWLSILADIYQILPTTIVLAPVLIARSESSYKYILQAFLDPKNNFQDKIYIASLLHTTSDISSQEVDLGHVQVRDSTTLKHHGKASQHPHKTVVPLFVVHECWYPL